MKRSEQLASRFREAILNGKWVANTNVKEQIDEVTLDMATKKIENLNTIAELTFHINYYISGVLNVLEGGDLKISDKYSFDMPIINSEQDWINLKTNLFENTEKFAKHVEKLSEKKLEESFIDEKYGDFNRNIDGLIEHSYYHFGQISLIKKLLASVKK